MTDEPTLADAIERRKFYHHEWPLSKLLDARNGGLVTDADEAWFYEFTSKDGTGGKFDMLYRRCQAPADDKDATIARLTEQVNTLTTEKHADAEAIGALEAKLAEVTASRDEWLDECITHMRGLDIYRRANYRIIKERDEALAAGTFAQGIEAAAGEWQNVRVEGGAAVAAVMAYSDRIRALSPTTQADPVREAGLKQMIEQARRRVEKMSDEERSAMYEQQRDSWVKGMMTPCEHGVLDFETCPQCRALEQKELRT